MKGWEKCPSVTEGGKEFFFLNRKLKFWVVWNRVIGAWVIRHWTSGELADKTTYRTSTAAIKAAERIK